MDAKQELEQLGRDWDRAILTNDPEKIGPFMSNDWVIAGPNGITSKEQFLDSIRSGSVTHNRMDFDEMRISLFGDTAVVITRGTSAGHWNGRPFHLYEWATSTFVKKNSGWLCVATMVAPAIEK